MKRTATGIGNKLLLRQKQLDVFINLFRNKTPIKAASLSTDISNADILILKYDEFTSLRKS